MLTMRLVLGNLLLFLALGPCFKSTDAQETTTETDENITLPLPNIDTVESTLSSEMPSATPENTVLKNTADPNNPETTLVSETNTMPEEPTGESTPALSIEIEQTSSESVPETTTVQTEQTTVNTPTVLVNVETTVIEQISSDTPTTSQYETTAGFTSPESTSPTEHPTDEITTAAVAMTTDSAEALNPTSILTTPPADWTESPAIMSDPVDASTETSTSTSTTSTSTTQLPQNTADYPSASTDFTTATGVITEASILDLKSNWLLIIIVFVAIIFVLCVGMILFARRRKKIASRNFGPMYMNGQSKRSKKKKGEEDDAWAGPVNLAVGAECDAELQEGLMPNNGKQDGDDMVLSTFAALEAGDVSNGGVGEDGTKEAKKWEEQEPLLYIDEDANEDKTGKTLEESEKQKGDEKSEEKEMNGGETFCLTTAV
ncbi:mucin-2 [Onychostoma macrolepis]|uniref:mucin-2 n=1 Tax=Onychostoma macrolepis TaxID=369639 RepID=UPI00272D67F4|nr:mucin-2 [Onychostoma macrolepis]